MVLTRQALRPLSVDARYGVSRQSSGSLFQLSAPERSLAGVLKAAFRNRTGATRRSEFLGGYVYNNYK